MQSTTSTLAFIYCTFWCLPLWKIKQVSPSSQWCEKGRSFRCWCLFSFYSFQLHSTCVGKVRNQKSVALGSSFRSSPLNSKSVQKEGGSTHNFHSTSSHQKRRGLQQNSDFYITLFAFLIIFVIQPTMNWFHYFSISDTLDKVGKPT